MNNPIEYSALYWMNIFWMNIRDFVLNWIFNWIIFRPDSMKKWIFKTDRPLLTETETLIFKTKKSLPKAKTQVWVQSKGRNKFRCNASAGETLKVTKLPRWPVVQFQGDLANRYIPGHSWQVTRYKGAAFGESPGTRVPPTISGCAGHSGC